MLGEMEKNEMTELRLKSGQPVAYRVEGTHLPNEMREILPEILAKIDSSEYDLDADLRFEACVDMGRTIGTTKLVPTSNTDEIVFAQLPHSEGLSRFVKNHGTEPKPTTMVTLIFKVNYGPGYAIVTGGIGHGAQREPWQEDSRPTARHFWAEHAYIWGTLKVIPETETTICPW